MKVVLFLFLITLVLNIVSFEYDLTGYVFGKNDGTSKYPTVIDPGLKVKLISDGLKYPTSIVFVDKSIIVLELVNGTIRMIENDTSATQAFARS